MSSCPQRSLVGGNRTQGLPFMCTWRVPTPPPPISTIMSSLSLVVPIPSLPADTPFCVLSELSSAVCLLHGRCKARVSDGAASKPGLHSFIGLLAAMTSLTIPYRGSFEQMGQLVHPSRNTGTEYGRLATCVFRASLNQMRSKRFSSGRDSCSTTSAWRNIRWCVLLNIHQPNVRPR